MGWLWDSLQSKSTNATASAGDATSRSATENGQKPVSVDSEFEALVASLDSPSTTTVTPAPEETFTHHAPSPSGVTSQEEVKKPLDVSPEALYPRTMSCRQAFDQAFYCQSFGGKFNDIYRYGEIRSCSDNWNAFWFCMRVKGLPDHEREERIKEYYQERETTIKAAKGSSEDIWDIRTEPVKKAFWRNPDELVEKS